ncbi:NUDIX domain-containing protein [Flavobacteriaceae bacterium R38]|nr:NUDIX domain-containing protein [Flavobacteriaceae bacterium R38]
MYKVFINESPVILTNKIVKEDDREVFLLETINIEEVIEQLNTGKIKKAYLFHKDEAELLALFKSKLPVVVAAGGLVVNQEDKILFIYRNGKWDMAKGKLDKGESIEEAAVREVEEETGVKQLKIDRFLETTYHVFERNGVFKLKETHWFLMNTSYKGKLIPQNEEGIEIVDWKDTQQIAEALKNSYQNIEIVISNFQNQLSKS